MLTRHSTELADPGGGPITGGQVVPSHWRNSHQSGPIPVAGDTHIRLLDGGTFCAGDQLAPTHRGPEKT